ncbi:MAG: hypothetical protein NTZ34_12315 [Chloroflexi bacterium]|nr:hypothetical protein [Chloroflexota bacterium]
MVLFWNIVNEYLKIWTLTIDEKQLLLNALEIRAFAYRDHSELRGVLRSYVTIAQTSACLSGHAYDYSIPFFVSI